MSLWRQVKHGVRTLLRRGAADGEIDEELAHYREELAAELERKGLSTAEAKQTALRETGSSLTIREEVRDAGWEIGISGWLDDCRYAMRRLSRSPGFAAAAVLTLALCVGAVTAIFTVIDHVLLRPLPYPHAGRLVALWHTAPGVNLKDLKMSPSMYFTYREEGRVFEDLALWNGNRSTVTDLGHAEEVPTLFVTHSFLKVLGIAPAIGRGFTENDGNWGSPRTVILSDAYWRQRFGGDPGTIGRRMMVNGEAHEVIGVLPPSFEFLDERVSLMVPKQIRREEVRLIQYSEEGIARLKPGVTIEQANADVARCIPLAATKFPLNEGLPANALTDARISPTLRFLKDHLIGEIRNTLWVVMGAMGLLLLIAAANVANLLLVRVDARRQELAVRVALGANRGRIARDLVTESLLLGVMGGVLGLGVSAAAVRIAAASTIVPIPRLNSLAIDWVMVAFGLATSILASLFFGLIPVWKYVRPHSTGELQGAARAMSQSRERRRTQRALVVVQMALAVVLLVGSGLMIRTFQALRSIDPGFTHPHEVQAVRVSVPMAMLGDAEAVTRMQEAILRKFAAIGGVESVAIATSAPMEGGGANPVYTEGLVIAEGQLPPVRHMRTVSPGFTAAIGNRIVAGRDITWADIYSGVPVAMISENMARELWKDPQVAVGKRLRESLQSDWREIVGVVGDIRDNGITRPAPTTVYWPLMRRVNAEKTSITRNTDVLVRTRRAGSLALVEELQAALQTVNRTLPLSNVRTLGTIYDRAMARTSFALVLIGIAGSMALVLGIVGIYGVIAYSVTRRRRDIGIRIALGSTLEGVTGMFVREGILLAAAGAVGGLVAAAGLTRLMSSLLFGVSPVDAVTYVTVLAGLVLAALLASWWPARRAAAVDPMEALRAD